MIKDLFISFKENFKDKTSNPFFGTLIIVWLTKNWNLFYSIFNFDSGTTLDQKRDFILKHFELRPFIETLVICVFEAFVILIVSYFLINLSRLIVNFYEKRVTPLVYKWTDENSIVLKSVYEVSENERKRLEKRVEEEREAKLKLQEDYDKLEKRIGELLAQKNDKENIPKPESKVKTPKANVEKSIDNSKITLLLNKLKKEDKLDEFEKLASRILNNDPIQKSNKIIGELVTIGLVTPGNYRTGPDWYNYNLTAVGKELHEMLLMEKLK